MAHVVPGAPHEQISDRAPGFDTPHGSSDVTSAEYAATQQRGSIQRVITQSETNKPISGVRVAVGLRYLPAVSNSPAQYQSVVPVAVSVVHAITDASGSFSVGNLIPGTYTVRADRNGYVPGKLALSLGARTGTETREASFRPTYRSAIVRRMDAVWSSPRLIGVSESGPYANEMPGFEWPEADLPATMQSAFQKLEILVTC
jgi:hypothetical protein